MGERRRPEGFPWDEAELRGVWQSCCWAGEGHPADTFAHRLWQAFTTLAREAAEREWRNECMLNEEGYCRVCRRTSNEAVELATGVIVPDESEEPRP